MLKLRNVYCFNYNSIFINNSTKTAEIVFLAITVLSLKMIRTGLQTLLRNETTYYATGINDPHAKGLEHAGLLSWSFTVMTPHGLLLSIACTLKK